MARCPKACVDSTDIVRDLTVHYQDAIHRPAWPYKFKIKVSACANDCAAASARSDLAIIGTWRDTLGIDQDAVRKYVADGFDIFNRVIRKCPSQCLEWNNNTLSIDGENCVRCLNCINLMPKALSVGKERGATVLVGGKAPVVKGAMIGWVLVPFIKAEAPYTEIKDLIDKATDWWAEHGRNRERISELIDRLTLTRFLKDIGIKPAPQMVFKPRSNPYIFWNDEEVVK
jgi:sulfite reductase alpha subunit